MTRSQAPPPFAKKCSCCKRLWSHAEWQSLEYLGIMSDPDELHALELRHCTCGSTISIKVRPR